jgi:hypothetical protein
MATRKPKIDTISDRTWQGSQSWNRERIETLNADRLRYVVKCDAYDFQSYAHVSVWRADGWQEIARISGPLMKTRVSYVDRNVTCLAFNADITELNRVARMVLK